MPQLATQATQNRPAEESTALADFIVRQRVEAAAGGNIPLYPPLTAAERQKAFEWTCKYGPGNCWTGATGTAAIIIRSLLLELAELKAKERGSVTR